jgi:uncharacterized membrane protein YphA (DoxX/SURF4 family)
VSEDSASEPKKCLVKTAACCVWPTLAAIVFLRLCVGWHFFSEGIKKFEYDQSRGEWKLVFSAEGFLSGAKGPLAKFFQDQAPTTHHWRDSLLNPKKLDTKESARLNAWVGSYVKRRQAELNAGKINPPQYVEFSPADAWGKRILNDWKAIKTKLVGLSGLSDEQRARAEEIYKSHELRLADFLAEESLAIEAYQHDLWRLEQARSQPGATEVPFEIARVDELQTRINSTPNQWIAAVKALDASYAEELRGLLTADQKASALAHRVKTITENPEARKLERMNWLVACVVTGVGVCLLLGLCTRVASIAGALFLLSVMATQPPWVPGAYTLVFYYQLVEFAALLFLAAVGAGRWGGLDFIIHGLWSKRRGAQRA